MIWLSGQLWPLLLGSFLLGAATVALWGQRRESREVWEDVPVPAPPAVEVPGAGTSDAGAGGPDGHAATAAPAAPTGVPVPIDADDPSSPFPVAATGGPAPWEADELWSRPARVGAHGESRRPKDEWAEAAENWRSWADEATGRGFGGAPVGGDPVSARDRDLFAADRAVEAPPGHAAGGTAATLSGRPEAGDDTGHDEPVDVFPPHPTDADSEDDVFPYARPVEAPRGGEGTMEHMDTPDMTEDEREAAEIRRMREQARRGDGA